MYTENCIEYIKTGLGFVPDRKQHIIMSTGSLILTLMLGLVIGFVLKGAWLFISMTMLVMSIAAFIATVIITSKGMTVKNRLIVQVIIALSFILALSCIDIMFYAAEYGFNIAVGIVFIPPAITPVLLGIRMSKKINKNVPFARKEMTKIKLRIGGMGLGIASMNIATFVSRDIGQDTAIIIFIVLSAIINIGMSIGLLSIQRLYYLDKLNKEGIFIE